MKVTLVSFAEGEPFASVRQALNASAAAAGFDDVILWGISDFENAPLTRKLWKPMQELRRWQHRPYCDAFKMVALLHAMERSADGDYVLWADSSRHFPYPLRAGSVHAAIARLNRGAKAPRHSIYGRINCVMPAGEPELELPVSASSHPAAAFAPYFASQRPLNWIVASQMLLVNSHFNRRLLHEWLDMAMRMPQAFCGHGTEDNYAFMALACNHTLSSIISQPVLQLDSQPDRFTFSVLSLNYFLATLEAGAFLTVTNGCGGQHVRHRCRDWLQDRRSTLLRLEEAPQAFEPEHGLCTNTSRWSQGIRAALETGSDLQVDYVHPCPRRHSHGMRKAD